MKKVVLLILVGMSSITIHAQTTPQKNEDARTKLEAARIAMITERLNLTPEQAEKFWPLYNQYAQERRALQQEAAKARQGMDLQHLTEEQSQKLIAARQKFNQDKLNLENKYVDRMNRVISARQMVALRKAEEDFRKMVLNRLEQRKRMRMQQQQMMNQREQRRQQGNN